MVHGRMLLEREQLGHADGARPAHAREIVPHQVHDHQVLGPVLVALGERAAERGVVHRAEPARPRALDRPGLDVAPVLVQPKEPLRRGAEHRWLAEVEIGGERGRIPAPRGGGTDRTATR